MTDSVVMGLQGCIACHNLADEAFFKQAMHFSSPCRCRMSLKTDAAFIAVEARLKAPRGIGFMFARMVHVSHCRAQQTSFSPWKKGCYNSLRCRIGALKTSLKVHWPEFLNGSTLREKLLLFCFRKKISVMIWN